MSKNTIMFEGFKDSQLNKKEALIEIYSALTDRGYNAIDTISIWARNNENTRA